MVFSRSWIALVSLGLLACRDEVGVNLFSVQDDIDLGREVRDEILGDPVAFPVVEFDDAPEAYSHLERVRDAVLASGEVEYATEFDWEVYLIDDPNTLNAFAAPGGYLFFYTGLIEYLEHEDYFAGVMGHEIAHAARRHSTKQLTRSYGVATLVEVILGGEPGLAAELASALIDLRFSRGDEADADDASVRYLCGTDYAADGTAGFFAQLSAQEGLTLPEFLSTHPASEHRVEDIRLAAAGLGCETALLEDADWEAFQAALP